MSEATFVLLPSLKVDDCVCEIVRRQLTRPFARSATAEEAVIRGRFAIHIGLKARKVETMRSPVETAEEILFNLPPTSHPADSARDRGALRLMRHVGGPQYLLLRCVSSITP